MTSYVFNPSIQRVLSATLSHPVKAVEGMLFDKTEFNAGSETIQTMYQHMYVQDLYSCRKGVCCISLCLILELTHTSKRKKKLCGCILEFSLYESVHDANYCWHFLLSCILC